MPDVSGGHAGNDPSARRTRELIERLIREGTVVARSDGSVHELFPVSVDAAEGEALRGWVERERGAHTIEIGLGYGVSALFICEALLANDQPDACHVVLDPNQSWRFADCGLQHIEEAGLGGLVEFHAEASEIALPRFLAEGRRFDLALVDGNHRFDGVFLDLIYLDRLVRGGGFIFVDDFQLQAVAKAASFCTSNLGWTVEEVSRDDDSHHWAVLRTPEVRLERDYKYFVDF
ncbi:MAG: class I SAM-dependent methyltransferase [Chloroflexi bacterium]|nr:class I SAM-dependent methyltransferase [Chloroflexota bacterium]MCY3939184.1 class I SAM-dependent methyltransferase [Chloroflexota bacterium]